MNEYRVDAAVIGDGRASAASRGVTPEPRGAIDHGLDLGIIGNGRLAALIDPW